MADCKDDVKTQEIGQEARLAETPSDAKKLERERTAKEPLRLGKRTYPVWTPAMVKAREELRKSGRKWYTLHGKLYDPRNLRESWKQVEENKGAPGVSGETIEEYSKTIEERLTRLGVRLKEQSFQPRPIRRAYIPKTDGSGKKRELGIPEVEDRIVQTAIVKVVEPIFEAKFLDGSFGFRPERSALHALERVEKAISTDRPWVVDADIRNCFGSIPHEPLMQAVATEVSDGKLLSLIRRFVKADIVEELQRWTPEEGTPQGAVLSPLLANIYMDGFDREMASAGFQVVRYADDFVVLCRTEEEAKAARKCAEEALGKMELTLHPEKTGIVDARAGRFQFLGYVFTPKGRCPRDPSLKKLRERIRSKTPRLSGESLRVTIAKLGRTLKGWYAYFRHGFHNVFEEVDGFVRRRLRSILRKHAKRRGVARNHGADQSRYPNKLFDNMGLLCLSNLHNEERKGRRLIPFPARA